MFKCQSCFCRRRQEKFRKMAAISSAKREFLSLKRAIGPKEEADISLKRTKRYYYTLLCKIDAKYIKGVSRRER